MSETSTETDTTEERIEYDFSKLGLRDDIPEHIYHRSPGISKHALDNINVSPMHYLTEKENPPPATPAMIFGSAFHCLVLEPDRFDEEYIKEEKIKKPTAAQLNAEKKTPKTQAQIDEWNGYQARCEGKIVIKDNPGDDPFWNPGDWQTIHNMRDAVFAHAVASILLDPDQGWSERSPYWRDRETARLCRSRIDFFNEAHGVAIDLKSAASARYSDFLRAVHEYRYHVQEAMYKAGLKAVKVPVQAFAFVVVEKKPPYAIGIYTLEKEAQHIGHAMWRQDMRTFDECKTKDEWPCYPPEVRDLILPPWAERGKFS